MPPRKKPNASSSSSKKQNQNQLSQPSKFGIQHFFHRHTQNTLLASQTNPGNVAVSAPSSNPKPSSTSGQPEHSCSGSKNQRTEINSDSFDSSKSVLLFKKPTAGTSNLGKIEEKPPIDRSFVDLTVENPKSLLNSRRNEMDGGVLAIQYPKNGSNQLVVGPNNLPENTPPDCLVATGIDGAEEKQDDEVSPQIAKSVSRKRFKFSPGMLIKQTQDDGADEVTWKISPVNERLHSVAKRMPEVIKVLAESSRLSSSNICQNLKNKTPGKLEKWLSSPTLQTCEKSLSITKRIGLVRANLDQEMNSYEKCADTDVSNNDSRQSPFQTPPSLSYCHDKPSDIGACEGVSDQLGPKQHKKVHKKALLELLDQVEDAISVEESASDMETYSSIVEDKKGDDLSVKDNSAVKRVSRNPIQMVNGAASNRNLLVLEVSEKSSPADSCAPQHPYKVLRLLNEQSGEERSVYLSEEWFYSVIAPGDTVNVIGEFDDEGKCDVHRDNNFLIVHPDILISGTRVAASSTCPRRTVLDERLKCNEHSTPALIGTLLHQVFQAGLMKEIPTKDFLEEYAGIVLQKNIESLYACGVNENDMYKTIIEAIPKLLNWILTFKNSQNSSGPPVDFGSDVGQERISITEVIDIEEMAWAPKYGLKGMIDASLKVKIESNINEVCEKIVPLEFKTGKGSSGPSSMEHRAQVILYTLLMSDRYMQNIDSGLLYYLQSDQTQGIAVRRSDLVGLIMRRNELASDIRKASIMQQLPQMLRTKKIPYLLSTLLRCTKYCPPSSVSFSNRRRWTICAPEKCGQKIRSFFVHGQYFRMPNMCKGCRHLDICTVYHKAHGGSTESSGLGDMFGLHVSHLTDAHFFFLRKWDRLIDLEAKEAQHTKNKIWRSCSPGGDNFSSCLSSIVLDMSNKLPHQTVLEGNRYAYRFVLQDSLSRNVEASYGKSSIAAHAPTSDLDCSLRIGDYVILTAESGHLKVASGIITDLSRSHVSVSFSKRIRLPGSNPSSEVEDLRQEVWRIDKDELVTSFAVMRFNLLQLFLQNAESSHLRKMIVDIEAPRFDSGCISSQDPAISYVCSEKSLNNDQRRAILKILTAKDYALILGMPGTGKTSTMVHAVKALLIRGASILLTSYTNSAVDNLLIKLKAQNIDFLRIGRHEAVHEEIQGHCFSAMDICGVEDIKTRLHQVKVVAVTCLGITTPLLANKKFDVCIMDEAGQTTLPVSLGPLMFASVFVLVGDHYQLPPLVKSTEARENGMGVSLFCRLSEAHPQAISALQSQYRMCQGIMELSNSLIYDNRLCCGSPEIANAKLNVSDLRPCSPWLMEVLDPSRPVIFIDTDMLPAFEVRDHNTVSNPIEAQIIAEVAESLVKRGVEGTDIGVITPYNSQTSLIRSAVYTTSVEIHTIDKYQGRDKDCIMVSFVRSSENARNCTSSLLGDWHRINVALTRAKKKLIMVGSCKTLSKVPLLKLLISKVKEQMGIMSVSNKDIKLKGGELLKRCSQMRQ